MSKEAVARFLELVASDESLEFVMNAAAERQADVPATAVALGEKHGLLFTSPEFADAVKAFYREHPGKLDEAELMGVTGGLNPQPLPPLQTGMRTHPWFSQQWATRPIRWQS